MNIHWSAEALSDFAALRAHIALENPAAVKEVAEHILQAISLLALYPSVGRVGRVPQTRELVVTNTPVIIPYRIEEGALYVLRIYHHARCWPEKL